MEICVVSPSYPTSKTVIFIFVDQLCKALADQGQNVTVIAPQSLTRCLLGKESFSKISFKLLTPRGNYIKILRPPTISVGNKKFRFLTRFFFNTAVYLTFVIYRKKFDVLYGHFWSSIDALLNISKQYDIPLFGASGEENVAQYDIYDHNRKLEFNKYLSGLISVSQKNKDECLEQGLVTENKISVIPNAVDLNLFSKRDKLELRKKLSIQPKDFVVVFVGQFVSRKGTLRLSEALTKLHDKHIKALFLGKGNEDPIYDGIIYKGKVEHCMLPNYLYASDVFVLPTENEGLCNAIIEAMACGLPVISTDAKFNYDILDENNSILIDCHNIEDIANSIKRLKNDPILLNKLSEGASETASRLSIENRASLIVDFIYSKLN